MKRADETHCLVTVKAPAGDTCQVVLFGLLVLYSYWTSTIPIAGSPASTLLLGTKHLISQKTSIISAIFFNTFTRIIIPRSPRAAIPMLAFTHLISNDFQMSLEQIISKPRISFFAMVHNSPTYRWDFFLKSENIKINAFLCTILIVGGQILLFYPHYYYSISVCYSNIILF